MIAVPGGECESGLGNNKNWLPDTRLGSTACWALRRAREPGGRLGPLPRLCYFTVRRPQRVRKDSPAGGPKGANADGNSDSIAILAGALPRARQGIEVFPADWVRDVERKERLRRRSGTTTSTRNGISNSVRFKPAGRTSARVFENGQAFPWVFLTFDVAFP